MKRTTTVTDPAPDEIETALPTTEPSSSAKGISLDLERYVFRKLAPGTIRYLRPPDSERATGVAAQVLSQAASEFQVVPPVTLHFARPWLMGAVVGAIREVLVAGPVDRRKRELVASVTSELNACPYCVDIHTMMLRGADEHELASAIAQRRETGVDGWDRLARWTRATLRPNDPALRAPPFSPDEAPHLLGTAVLFHYINRMVNVFLAPSPFPLPTGLKWLEAGASWLAGRTVGRRLVSMRLAPGNAVSTPESAELPDELGWARANPPVARALATLANRAVDAGKEALAPEVRALVQDRVRRWNGEAMPMGKGWIDEAVSGLDARHHPAARLSLSTALASYRVDEHLVAAFRESDPDDGRLLGATAWSSYVAAQRIGSWIAGA